MAYDETSKGAITNTREKGSLKIRKNVTVNGAAPETDAQKELVNGKYTFAVTGPDGYSETIELEVSNGVSNEEVLSNLPTGKYTITENPTTNGTSLVGDDNPIEIEVTKDNTNDVPTAEFTNNIDVTELPVAKTWKNADGSNASWPSDIEKVTIQLTRKLEGEESFTEVSGKTLELTAKDPEGAFENLPTVVDGKAATYDAAELTVSGYVTTKATVNGTITFTNKKADKPTFDKKIQDKNDTTGESSDWQDSADYDIDDPVPYKLTATLANDVSAYGQYWIRFNDQMEESLDFNGIDKVTVGGVEINAGDYVINSSSHAFTLTIRWGRQASERMPITENLNGAKVEVFFTATLNSKANIGSEGNVNGAQLTYSNNPSNTTDSETTPWDYVIAFTYKLDVSKVDEAGAALEGATFKLEKKLVNGKLKTIALAVDGNKFSAKGLDDGIYVLTEITAPTGFKKIDPIEFTVEAGHTTVWDATSDWDKEFSVPDSRSGVLTGLTGDAENGEITFAADDALEGLSGDVKNTALGGLKLTKKVTVDGKATNSDKADGTYRFAVAKKVASGEEQPSPVWVEITVRGGKAISAKVAGETAKLEDGYVTVSDLEAGTYEVREQKPENGTYIVGENIQEVVVEGGKDAEVKSVVFTNNKPGTPDFEKKIADINDSTDTEQGGWQDSADYDIGDPVPYKLTAKLPNDVSTYTKGYQISFVDTMEPSLTFNKGSVRVVAKYSDGTTENLTSRTTIGGVNSAGNAAPNADATDQAFSATIHWTTDADSTQFPVLSEKLNGATIELYFDATLNSNAKLGKDGNINGAKLQYNNKPDSTGYGSTEWDYVIAFTYKLDVSKIDEKDQALEGATFKLEKKLADGTLKTIALAVAGNKFSAKGLDDGIYVLTELTAPKGYKKIDPIKFTVTAKHEIVWDVHSDANGAFAAPASRAEVLSKLTGNVTTGELTLTADEPITGLSGDVKNTKLGGLEIKKNVTVNGKTTTGKEADGTYTFQIFKYDEQAEGHKGAKVGNDVTIKVENGVSNTATVESLDAGKYIVSEISPTNGTYLTSQNDQVVEVKDGATTSAATAEFTNNKPGTPDFEKKIADINDSTDTEQGGWQDSADYDIGDAVPYKLTAKLANDVSTYKRYWITFEDQMEDSLTFKEITKVTINGDEVTNYTLTPADHSFTLGFVWEGTNGGTIGESVIGKSLDGATVEVYFDATLNSGAKLGKDGNVNGARLNYANKPNSTDTGDKGEKTPWDYVVAFTYKVDINKVDKDGAALSGATFKLEKKLADNTLELIDRLTVTNGTKFTFKGLDDGDYILTETEAPNGYKAIDPIEFTVTADHEIEWKVTSDDQFSPIPSRDGVLAELTGDVTTGELEFEAIENNEGLTGDVVNEEHKKPEFEKKIKDTNDSTGETSEWQDSADYDIGDAVPYKLTAKLPNDVTSYKHYHITFTDQMEKSLTFKEITKVTVNGTEVTAGTKGELGKYFFDQTDDQNFTVRLDWDGGKDANDKAKYISDEDLNDAIVEVEFTATLNSGAELGKQGNVNAAKLTYSNNSLSDEDGKDTEDTKWDYVIAFTYKLDVSKVDQNDKALSGAKFKLEKKIKGASNKTIALAMDGNKFSAKGLDDGDYILTELAAPKGYKKIDPIEFTVTAEHEVIWKTSDDDTVGYESEELAFDGAGRKDVLISLTGKATTGELELKADEALEALTGNVKNTGLEGEIQFDVEKTLKGLNSDNAPAFSFKLEQTTPTKDKLIKDPLTATTGATASDDAASDDTTEGTSSWTAVDGADVVTSTTTATFNKIPVSIDDLKFTDDETGDPYGEFTFAITEVVPEDAVNEAGENYKEANDKSGVFVKGGISYREQRKVVTVVVEPNADGTALVATYNEAEKPAESFTAKFTNTYEAKGSYQLSATKAFEDDVWPDSEDETFTFRLFDVTDAENERQVGEDVVVSGKSEDAKTAVFDEIAKTFDQTDATTHEFKYEIREVVPDDAINADGVAYADAEGEAKKGTFTKKGITYDAKPIEVEVTLTDNDAGELVPTVKANGEEVTADETTGVFDAGDITNKFFKAQGKLTINKSYFGQENSFSFQVTPADETGTKINALAPTAPEGDSVDYDANQGLKIEQKFAGGEDAEDVAISIPTLNFYEPGDYYFLVEELAGADGTVYDDALYLAKVTIAAESNTKAVDATYQLSLDGGKTWSEDKAPTFYNNGLVTIEFDSDALNKQNASAGMGFYQPEIRKVLENGTVAEGQFTFELLDESRSVIATATNDANGLVTFDALEYEDGDEATYTYFIREKDESAKYQTIKFSDEEIVLTVDVSKVGEELVVDGTYALDGEETEAPTITNALKGVRIHAVKTSREDGEAVAGATYGLWMANEGGNDVYMGSCVSDADGNLYYDIPATSGVTYYLKEEGPAPDGHLIDPYPTERFTLKISGSNEFALEYESGGTSTSSSASADIVTLEYAPEANGVEDSMTHLQVNKFDAATHEYVKGAHLVIYARDGGSADKPVAEWVSGEGLHEIAGALNVETEYVLHEVSAPEGYAVAKDVTFVLHSTEGQTTGEILSGATYTDETGKKTKTNAEFDIIDEDGETAQGFVISLYDEALPSEKVVHRSDEVERKGETRRSLARTSDLLDQPLMAGLAGAGLAILLVGIFSRRRKNEGE